MKIPRPSWIVPILVLSTPAVVHAGESDRTAREILRLSGAEAGLCVQLDSGDGRLLAEFARTGRFLVHGLSSDTASLATVRKRLAGEGLAGIASAEALPLSPLPYADNMVNLLVAYDLPGLIRKGLRPAEILRVLCPNGAACLGVPPAKRKETEAQMAKAGIRDYRFERKSRLWLVLKKPRPAEMDDWTHLSHGPDGNPVSHDLLIQAPNQLKWITGPSWGNPRWNAGPVAAHPHGVLSAGGRNYYCQGSRLIARDAFNGVLLWVKRLPSKVNMRRMVAVGDEVYLCQQEEIVALAGATGEVVRSYAKDVRCSQLLLDDGVLFSIGSSGIRAFEAATGKVKWRTSQRASGVIAEGGRLFFVPRRNQLVCLSQKDGREVWKKDVKADAGDNAQLLFASHGIVLLRTRAPGGARFTALSGKDGARAWSAVSNKQDALAYLADGLLWIENDAKTPPEGQPGIRTNSEIISKWVGRDPGTGRVRRTIVGPVNVKYRCHTLYATDRFAIGNRPFYFVDWKNGDVSCFEGTRAQCGSAYCLAHGMLYGLYTTSQKCMCMSTVISGITAFAADGRTCNGEVTVEEDGRFAEGPGVAPSSPAASAGEDWPMYRHDNLRSACAAGRMPGRLAAAWEKRLLPSAGSDTVLRHDWLVNKPCGDAITAPTVAAGKVFVSLIHAQQVVALDEKTGQIAWTFHAPARVDAPPTIYQGLCLFGCHDGWVYCLRAADGEQVWRFRAAPAERRMVAYGQVESAWPVTGGVLLVKDTAYVIAGRTTEADGGLYVHALEPKTGKLLWTGRRFKKEDVPFGGYTPRRGTTYVGPADILCSDGLTVSIAGCARGRFDCRNGEDRKWSTGGLVFGWVPSRYYTDQYGTKYVPVAFLEKTPFMVDRKTKGIRKYVKGGWLTAVPRPMIVEALAVAGDALGRDEGIRCPTVRVKAVDKAPKIDGEIDDLYAEQATPLSFSFLDGRKNKPKEATTCYILSDRENLYMAFRCEKPDPDRVVCRKTERDDNVWQDECVEIFIDPRNSRGDPYFHIIVNPAGITQEIYRKDNSWNPGLTVRCGKEKGKAWIAEVKIPFEQLGVEGGRTGHVWSLNLNRSARDPANPATCEDTAWSPTYEDSSHVPAMFGHMWLDALEGEAGGKAFEVWYGSLRPVVRAADRMPKIDGDTAVVLAAVSYNSPDRAGGELWVLSAKDGKKLSAHKLPAAPAFDGLAVAGGKVYVALQDGTVTCLGAE